MYYVPVLFALDQHGWMQLHFEVLWLPVTE